MGRVGAGRGAWVGWLMSVLGCRASARWRLLAVGAAVAVASPTQPAMPKGLPLIPSTGRK